MKTFKYLLFLILFIVGLPLWLCLYLLGAIVWMMLRAFFHGWDLFDGDD